MNRESGRRVVVRVADELDDRLQYSGGFRLADRVILLRIRTLEVRDGSAVCSDDGHRTRLCGVGLGESALEAHLEVLVSGVVLFLGDVTAADESLGVERTHGALRLDE